jgi:hypothetical protein
MSLPPSGEIPQGAIRFNTDSQRLEFYAQGEWWVMSTDTPNLGESGDSTPGARGVFAGAYADDAQMEYINISSRGNGTSFGNLTGGTTTKWLSGVSSQTRGVFAGGLNPGYVDTIQFITFASTGNATNFTDTLSGVRLAMAGMSNGTRGVFAGGQSPSDDHIVTIEYITIASTAQTRGDLVEDRRNASGASSPTRGLIAGGSAPGLVNTIEFVQISTLGDAQDFGDLTLSRAVINGSCSNATRGIFAGGGTPTSTNVIDYVNIVTTGNAMNFGDLTVIRQEMGGVSSPTRGVFAGGRTVPSSTELNTMDYVEIATEGNAVDFGDLATARRASGSVSNAHGGL